MIDAVGPRVKFFGSYFQVCTSSLRCSQSMKSSEVASFQKNNFIGSFNVVYKNRSYTDVARL